MLKIKIKKVEWEILELIKQNKFFEYTYQEIADKFNLPSPQCVVNQVNALERKWMISIVRYEKRYKWKRFVEFIVHTSPQIEVLFEK